MILRFFFLLFLLLFSLQAAEVQNLRWAQGESFLTFLEKYKIPSDVYFKLSKTDRELCTEIIAGSKFEILTNDKNELLQALIPINEELQIHIKNNSGKYVVDFSPISYFEHQEILTFELSKSPYEDIVNLTNNTQLANEFINDFKNTFDFKKLKIGDSFKIKYKQRVRNGKLFGSPVIDGAFVQTAGKPNFLVKQDGFMIDEKGRVYQKFFMKTPISYKRISSRFTLKRFHPVLKIYRAHLGVDYSANIGTKVFSAADGKIIFKGIKGGYGRTVVIKHDSGYKTLYGHLSSFDKKLKIGQKIKQGQLIAFSGNSGVSSGPHLHFGVYRNEKPVDPLSVIKATKVVVEPKRTMKIKEMSNATKAELMNVQILNVSKLKFDDFENKSQLNPKK